MTNQALGKKALKPSQMMALGFLGLILIGGLLLALPVASATGRSLGALPALFTATSAVCVTGLSIIEPGTELSLFGQIVLIALIQMGGLGFMAFATLTMVVLGRRVSLRNRMLISESLNQSALSGMVKLTLWFFLLAFCIELAGAALLASRFIPLYGAARGIWFGVFHSISAFCNAGFDILGQGRSLIGFQGDATILLTLAFLIILGGMGFSVLLEVLSHRKSMGRLSLHAKLVLTATGALLLLGTLCTLLLEWDNPGTLGEGMGFGEKLLNSFFQSVTLRTAGFAAVDQGALTDATKLLSCVFMFIGASSASTGGGVKTTTFVTVLLLVLSVIKGRERITVFGREIAQDTARRAVSIVTIALGFMLLTTCALSILERSAGVSLLDLAFETTSAITTTGLSAAGTGSLRVGSQILLMPLMYLGRVGPLTLAAALISRAGSGVENRVHHPEEKIMIG